MTVNLDIIAKEPMATAASTFRRVLRAPIPLLQTTRHDNSTIHIVVSFYPTNLVHPSYLSLCNICYATVCIPAQIVIARTMLSTTAWRAGLRTRASQTQTFVYCPSHPQNATCNAKPGSKVLTVGKKLPLLPVTCPVI